MVGGWVADKNLRPIFILREVRKPKVLPAGAVNMRRRVKLNILVAGIISLAPLLVHQTVLAENFQNASYFEINLSNPKETQPIQVFVSREQSEITHWRAGQRLQVSLFTESAEKKLEPVRDADGNLSWGVTLDAMKEGTLSVMPGLTTKAGKLVVRVNEKILGESADTSANRDTKIVEKVYEYRFPDGVKIKVHFTDQMLEQSGESVYFPKDVLNAAVQAYQTITQFKGFSAVGYSFAFPDPAYAYDPDRTMDIYLGSPTGDPEVLNHGFNALSFKDAPCFDTLKISDTQYQAAILLPSNYKEFIKNWERINPSSLGTRNMNVDLRGTLIHEMLHVVLFYYNKNLNKDIAAKATAIAQPSAFVPAKKVDWYVEGLARYFETFAGARHDFFSQGFKQTLPDKIRFSRGGSNYFMRYPDQAFTDLRYENALFWRFMDYRYGMPAIERLSRDFRDTPNRGFESALEKAAQTSFKDLLKTFAMSILLKDFGLKEDSPYLKNVAKTHLIYRKGDLYLVDGKGAERNLGKVCRTDWIGRWENVSAKFDELPAAGDNTKESDVSGWATDYFQIDLDKAEPTLPNLGVTHRAGGLPLTVQIVMVTHGGSLLTKDLGDIPSSSSRSMPLGQWVGQEGLSSKDIDRIYILITNTDPRVTTDYEITANS